MERVRSHEVLIQKHTNDIMTRNQSQKNVGTMWVLTEEVIQEKQDFKTRLVVQGCQDGNRYITTGAPAGSRDAFLMTRVAADQRGWDYIVFGKFFHCVNLRDARRWTCLFVESKLEQGCYYLPGAQGPEAFGARAEDFLIAFMKASKGYRDALRLKQHTGKVV